MQICNKRCYTVVALLSALLSRPLAASEPAIVFLAQDSQPKYFFIQGRLEGLCADIYRALETKLAQHQISVRYPSQFSPIKRIFSTLEADSHAVFCGAAKNEDREQRFRFSSVPVYPVNYVLATYRDNQEAPNSFAEIQQGDYTIGAFYATSSAREIKTLLGEHRVNDSFTDLNMALKVLGTPPHRLKYFYYHDIGLNYLAKTSGYPLKVLPVQFSSRQHWLVYSKSLPSMQAQALESAMSDLEQEGILKRILKRYTE